MTYRLRRRAALQLIGGLTIPCVGLARIDRADGHLQVAPAPSLLEALEQHGQWASDGTWSSAIHQSMGALFTVTGIKEVQGTDVAEAATDLVLRMLPTRGRTPDGVTVVVTGPPGALRIRDAHDARQAVLRRLPSTHYCACSPRYERERQQVLTVEMALGWWPTV